MKKQLAFNTVLVFLALHLFMIYTKLFYHGDLDNINADSAFSFFTELKEKNILAMVSALSYSIVTVICVNLFHSSKWRLWVMTVFAVLDGFGVYVYFGIASDWFQKVIALYFAVYTAYIVFIVSMSQAVTTETKNEVVVEKTLDDHIRDAYLSGDFSNQAEIARHFNTNEMRVSRALKPLKSKKK